MARPVGDVQKPAKIPPMTHKTTTGKPMRVARLFQGETIAAAGAALGVAAGFGFLLGAVGPLDTPALLGLLVFATASLYPARAVASRLGKQA